MYWPSAFVLSNTISPCWTEGTHCQPPENTKPEACIVFDPSLASMQTLTTGKIKATTSTTNRQTCATLQAHAKDGRSDTMTSVDASCWQRYCQESLGFPGGRAAHREAHGVCDHVDDVADGHFVLLAHRQDDGVCLLVLAQHPDHEACQVQVVDELTPAARHYSAKTFCTPSQY